MTFHSIDLSFMLVAFQVHLSGAFKVTKAAWPHFKKQKYGRIIMTSSGAGIYGNYGQANYSAAKLGLLGLSNTLALEGERYNIFSNTIAPLAASRLTENVMPKEVFEMLQPKYVAPIVVYLCHESCEENGSLFETGAGWTSRLRWQGTKGVQFRKFGEPLTADIIKEHWNDLSNWEDAVSGRTIQTTVMDVTSSVQGLLEDTAGRDTTEVKQNDKVNPSKAIGFKFDGENFSFTPRDAILYALGVGTKLNDASRKYLFEGHENFSVLPTFAIMFAQV